MGCSFDEQPAQKILSVLGSIRILDDFCQEITGQCANGLITNSGLRCASEDSEFEVGRVVLSNCVATPG